MWSIPEHAQLVDDLWDINKCSKLLRINGRDAFKKEHGHTIV